MPSMRIDIDDNPNNPLGMAIDIAMKNCAMRHALTMLIEPMHDAMAKLFYDHIDEVTDLSQNPTLENRIQFVSSHLHEIVPDNELFNTIGLTLIDSNLFELVNMPATKEDLEEDIFELAHVESYTVLAENACASPEEFSGRATMVSSMIFDFLIATDTIDHLRKAGYPTGAGCYFEHELVDHLDLPIWIHPLVEASLADFAKTTDVELAMHDLNQFGEVINTLIDNFHDRYIVDIMSNDEYVISLIKEQIAKEDPDSDGEYRLKDIHFEDDDDDEE